jgi:hypothetical protein
MNTTKNRQLLPEEKTVSAPLVAPAILLLNDTNII